MKKILSIVLCIMFAFIAFPACASNVITAESTLNDATVTINLGTAYANRQITVAIYAPSYSVDSIVDDDVAGKLSLVTTKITDAEGRVSFNYNPGSVKGVYKVVVSGSKIYKPFYGSFEFISDDDVTNLIDEIKKAEETKTVSDMFVKYESPEIYAAYQILGLHNAAAYDIYDNLNVDTAELVSERIFKYRAKLTDASSVEKLFNESVLWESLYKSDDAEDIIDTLYSVAGIGEEKIFTDIYSNKEICDANLKGKIAKEVSRHNYSLKTSLENKPVLLDALLLGALSNVEGYGFMDEIISAGETLLKTSGADFSYYNSGDGTKMKALHDLQPYDDLKDFASEFNKVFDGTGSDGIQEDDDSDDDYNRGGYGGGKTYSVDTSKSEDKEPLVSESPKNEILFDDLDGVRWAVPAIEYLYDKGIVKGVSQNKFAPTESISRAQFATLISRIFNFELSDDNLIFSDIPQDCWYRDDVYALASSGIITGFTDGTFRGNSDITREDMAVIITRALDKKSLDLDKVNENINFADSSEISPYALSSVEYLNGVGIINGVGNNMFAPKRNATRAETAQLIYNLLGRLEKK